MFQTTANLAKNSNNGNDGNKKLKAAMGTFNKEAKTAMVKLCANMENE